MKVVLPIHFATIDAVAIVTMISLKINNKKWTEELTELLFLDTQLFVEIIIRSVSHWCCYIFEKVLIA